MTGWEVSRHPEWDMMYTAGMTAREIADRSRGNVATVHLHLRVREKYVPGFRAVHEAALVARGPNRPTARWRRRINEVMAFHTANQRLPSGNKDSEERALARWLADQRNSYKKGQLSVAKINLLNELTGWSISPQKQRRDDHWWSMLAEFDAFVAATGEMPRYKNYMTENERKLGVWLHVQHQRKSENSLLAWRLAALNCTVPSWRSRS